MAHPVQTYKNKLQQYSQKKCLPLPVYHVVNEGKDHLPQFKCSLTINGTRYESPPGFSRKKAAQNAAAKKAVEDLQKQGFKFKESKWPKCVLAELASINNLPPPTYHFIKDFTATVEINGASYTGAPANNMKEAANNAAFEGIWAIDPQYYIALSIGEPHVSKSQSKMPADNFTSNHELLGGMESKTAEIVSEKLNVKDAPALEKATGDVYQNSPKVGLTESISKRSRIESENAEQTSERTKKQKGKKREPENAEQTCQRTKQEREEEKVH